MRYIYLFLLFVFISSQSSAQDERSLFGGEQINLRALIITPYYEMGNDRINQLGLSGSTAIYKKLFLGIYGQWGRWESPEDSNDFKSKFRQGGLILGHVTRIKKSKFSVIPVCYFGRGRSTSVQDRPIAFVDAQIKFNVFTPEVGLEYRFVSFGALMISTGRHFYKRTDQDEQPIGFGSFELNQYYGKIGLRIGY